MTADPAFSVTGERYGAIIRDMPSDVSVVCPRCGGKALFTAPYHFTRDADASGVQWSGGIVVERFPDVFSWRDPKNPYLMRTGSEIWGVLSCTACPLRRKHQLAWPADAYYKAEVDGEVLWAWDRGMFAAIRGFIASDQRDVWAHPTYGKYFLRLPKHFLLVSRRDRCVRAIDNVLRGTSKA